jgi:hypothetical protein
MVRNMRNPDVHYRQHKIASMYVNVGIREPHVGEFLYFCLSFLSFFIYSCLRVFLFIFKFHRGWDMEGDFMLQNTKSGLSTISYRG